MHGGALSEVPAQLPRPSRLQVQSVGDLFEHSESQRRQRAPEDHRPHEPEEASQVRQSVRPLGVRYLDTIDLPGFAGHRRMTARDWLRRHLPQAQELAIQTGYYTGDALRGVLDLATDLIARGGRIRLVVGDREDQFDVEDLAALLTLAPNGEPDRIQVTIVTVAPGMFHSKTLHLIMADGSHRALVGSGNATGSGWGTNAEAWIELTPGDDLRVLESIRASTLAWSTSPAARNISLAGIQESLPVGHRTSPLAVLIEDAIDGIEAASSGATSARRVPTGFAELDRLLGGGFDRGWLVVVAGRPGLGKSTFLNDLLRSCAIHHQIPAALFSLEMESTAITNRLLSAEARIPLQHLVKGTMRAEDWERLAKTMAELSEAPLFINVRAGVSIPGLRRELEQLTGQGVRLVGVDYLQLMPGLRRQDNRQMEVSEISRALKNMAREFNITIVAVSALNRGSEQRSDRRPMLADLRDSGQIEADADLVVLIHREDAYEKESPRAGEADLIIAKNRHGPADTITVAFQGHYSRFVDMAV